LCGSLRNKVTSSNNDAHRAILWNGPCFLFHFFQNRTRMVELDVPPIGLPMCQFFQKFPNANCCLQKVDVRPKIFSHHLHKEKKRYIYNE
jgi:hypothetical protein